MKLDNVLLVYTRPAAKEYKSTLKIVERTLRKNKISFELADRDGLSKKLFRNREFIIAVGGDGTFLRTAQFVGNQIILGVNADVRSKEGFLMNADKLDFEEKLRLILDGRHKLKLFPRLEALINDRKLDTLALNEFFIGPVKSYHAAKYIISANGMSERQKSSGILVSTPAGSYAWSKACTEKTLPIDSSGFQFVVREPYEGKVFRNYRLVYGKLNKTDSITIKSEMRSGILIADSVGKEHSFGNGRKAVIKMSKSRLRSIWFN